MLHTKYQSSSGYSLGQEDFQKFLLYLYVKPETPQHMVGLISPPGQKFEVFW